MARKERAFWTSRSSTLSLLESSVVFNITALEEVKGQVQSVSRSSIKVGVEKNGKITVIAVPYNKIKRILFENGIIQEAPPKGIY